MNASNMILTDVYFQTEKFNRVCQATIPAAWIAVLEDDTGIVIENAFAYPNEFSSVKDARKKAESIYTSNIQ